METKVTAVNGHGHLTIGGLDTVALASKYGTPLYVMDEDAIRAIASSVSVPIELGGGIRSAEAVKNMLDLGITRCIIGTRAVERPEFMKELVETFGADRIVAGVDAKNGMVAVEGWEKVSTAFPRFTSL